MLNITYDYNPIFPKDELVDIAADVMKILVPALRPDIAVVAGAFPFCESITFSVVCLFHDNRNL